MSSSGSHSGSSVTQYRLLKPMPSLHAARDPHEADPFLLDDWDSQVRRLFPPPGTSPRDLAAVHGIRLGHFVLEERIGRGGMGSVFRARDLRLDRTVALKVLAPDQLREPGTVQRFQNEARAAARLDHDNIARVYFVGEERGVHFIAFEYVHGTTVRDLINRAGRLSLDDTVNYTLQVAAALEHTDAAGMVHRDIKPSNLIVTPSGRVKLVDLGLARSIQTEGEQDLTVSGTTLGTFDYISPEQARNPRNVDVRSDIYSLGCTLYHMLTGSAPYADAPTLDKLMLHSTGDAPDPAELNPSIPPRLSLIVQRMMASNPDERYSTAGELLDELLDAAQALGLRAFSASSGEPRPASDGTLGRWEETRGWLFAFAVILFLAVTGDKIYLWFAGIEPPEPQLGLSAPVALPVEDPVEPASASSDEIEPAPPPAPPVEPLREPTRETAATPDVPAFPERMTGPASSIAMSTAANLAEATADRPGRTPRATVTAEMPVQEETNPETPVTPIPAPLELPFIVHDETGEETGRYPTLEAACHAAETGSVIDIDYDGELPRAQTPVVVREKRLTIRPAVNKRPILRFVPGDSFIGNGDLRMIEVSDGALELLDLELRMEVTRDLYVDRWVFISLMNADQLQMRRVKMGIENLGWRDAAIIERRLPPNSPANMMAVSDGPAETEIVCEDSLLQGGADFYLDRTYSPATVWLHQVAIGVDGDFLRLEGLDRVDMEPNSRGVPALKCLFDHITVVSNGAIVRINTDTARDAPELRIDTDNSLLELAEQSGHMIVLEGHQHSELLLQKLVFSGERNLFVGEPAAAVLVRGSLPSADDEWEFSFDQWRLQSQQQWTAVGNQAIEDQVLAMTPGRSLREAALETIDFSLRPEDALNGSNPAISRATDRSDLGFQPSISSLPASTR